MAKFAADTSVSVEKSQAEIKSILTRYGTSKTMLGEDNEVGTAVIQFAAQNRVVKFVQLPLRSSQEFAFRWDGRSKCRKRRTEQQVFEAWERSCRQKWRAMTLCIKAKLEAVESGISEFEDEFLAHIVLGNGDTVGRLIRPQIADNYSSGAAMSGITALLEHKS